MTLNRVVGAWDHGRWGGGAQLERWKRRRAVPTRSSRYARRRAIPFEGFLASVVVASAVVASAAVVAATAAAEAAAAALLLGDGCSGGTG